MDLIVDMIEKTKDGKALKIYPLTDNPKNVAK